MAKLTARASGLRIDALASALLDAEPEAAAHITKQYPRERREALLTDEQRGDKLCS